MGIGNFLFSIQGLFVVLSCTATIDIKEERTITDTSFCIENKYVNHFVNDFEYTESYDYTFIETYTVSTELRKDYPSPCIIEGPKEQNVKLIVSRDSTFLTHITPLIVQDSNSWQVSNLAPGRYFFLFENIDSGACVKTGCFNVTGKVRMINAGGILNVRDVGGWSSSLGGTIKYGRLIRGGKLEEAPPDDLKAIVDIGINSELDLRGNAPVGLVDDKDYHFCALDNFLDIKNVERNCSAIRILINELSLGKNIYVHCSGGADRTGVFCLLVEGACGVSESDISKEYELTSFSTVGVRKRNSGGFPEAMEYVKSFSGANLQEKFVSYLLAGGLNSDEIAILISELVEKNDCK